MTEQKIYNGDFSSWMDVIEKFHGAVYATEEEKLRLAEIYPEPEHVLYAEYGGSGYDGSAVVVWFDKGKFYTNEGSHCSCYGLENQWNPEEYEPNTFLAVLDRKIENAWNESGEYPLSSKLVWRLIKTRAEKLLEPLK